MDANLELPRRINDEELNLKQRSFIPRRRKQGGTKRSKLTHLNYSELNDAELMAKFGGSFRFELCRVVLTSAFVAFADHKLFGTIQAAGAGVFSSSDPLLCSSSDIFIFNREFNNPVRIPGDTQTLHDVGYCSLPVSSTSVIQIAAKLHVATDKIDDVVEYLHEDYIPDQHQESEPTVTSPNTLKRHSEIWEEFVSDWNEYNEPFLASTQEQTAEDASLETEVESIFDDYNSLIDHEVFHVSDDRMLINISDTPNGGASCSTLYGGDGYLFLYYVVFKYAVDAEIEVKFKTPPNAAYTEVTGSIWAYYGQGFDYDKHADNCRVLLLNPGSYVMPGRVNLHRSVLAVPANSSLIIEANLSKGGVDILTPTLEFLVPLDRRRSYETIEADGYSLKLSVNWKLPFEDLKICSSSNSSVSCHLAERRKFGAHSTSTMADPDAGRRKFGAHSTSTMADPDAGRRIFGAHSTSTMAVPDERNRWSLQEEIAKVFNTSLKRTYKLEEDVPCSISTCTKEDGGDYLCSGVMHTWPEIKSCHLYEGPKHAGVAVKDYIMGSEYKEMMERCVVCGPGFVKFKLCRKWIAKSIHTMLTFGIETWAPKLSVKKTFILYSLSPCYPVEISTDLVRSRYIGETLACMLEYSGADVEQIRLPYPGPLGSFIEDWEKSQDKEQVNNTIQRIIDWLGIYVKKESYSFYECYIGEIMEIVRDKGLRIGSGENELSLADLLFLGYLLITGLADLADWIVYVSDVGKRVYIEMCINAAERAGLIANDDPKCRLSHVGFGLVQGNDFERFGTSSTKVNLDKLHGEATSRCKMLLARQAGITDEWTADELEYASKALGHGAVRYADLKNNRLTNYTFSFDQMLNEEGNTAVYLQFTYVRICSIIRNSSKYIEELTVEELILKHDDERELGLHLLRFTEVLREVCTFVTPHILCDYLHGLCKKFNGLDSYVWQVNSDYFIEGLTAFGSTEEFSKLLLCMATKKVMKKCFYLLGIARINKIDDRVY